MKVRTKAPMKKAAVLPAAMKNKLRFEPYQKGKRLSSLKLQIGELLLFGDKSRKASWGLFEVLLMHYIEQKYLGGRP